MADEELLAALIDTLPYLKGGPEAAAKLDARKRAQLLAAMSGLKARAKTLNELLDGAGFLFAERPLAPDEKAASLLSGAGGERLAALAPRLAALPEWTAATTEAAVREAATSLSL
jgi:glutamyl-tRNA synthetase